MILPLLHFVALSSIVTATPHRLDKRQDDGSLPQSAAASVSAASAANNPVPSAAASGAVSADTASTVLPDSSAVASPPGASIGSASSVGDGGAPSPSAPSQPSAVGDGGALPPPATSQASAVGDGGAPSPSASLQASVVGDGGAPPASASAPPQASAIDGSAASSQGEVPVSVAPPVSVGEVDGGSGGNGSGAAAAGGVLVAGAVYTTTRIVDADPFPITQTIVETKTVPTDAAGGQATITGNVRLAGLAGLGGAAAGFGKQVISASGNAVEAVATIIPQPPLPSKSNSADPSVFTPAVDWDVQAAPRIREFNWDIEYTAGAPDGFHRRMTTINGMYPGPLLEANKGDVIVVHVNNHLNRSQSIHWHGLRQLKTPFMDGVPGTTQCPIRAGESFTYRFSVEDESGTYWWHSHSGNTQADGLHGGFLVHSPDEPYQRGRDYDEERIVYVTDWMRDQSDDIVAGILHEDGYRGGPVVPAPDSSLVNGVGQTVCADADPTVQCDVTQPATMQISQNRTRIRLISTSSHAMYRVSVDQHTLTVIEVDDTPIEPFEAPEIALHPGQRYSFIIDGTANSPGDQIFLRSSLALGCLEKTAREQEQKLVLQIPGDSLRAPVDQPSQGRLNPNNTCVDFAFNQQLVPRNITPVPQTSFANASFETVAGQIVNFLGESVIGFNVSGVSYVNYANKPALREVALNRQLNASAAAAVTFNGPIDGAVDILLSSLDDGRLSHPFHVHSRPFYIIARGSGVMTLDGLADIRYNLENPLRRDVITLAGQEWALLRIPADTPGVWPMHCHIGWHLAAGKQGLINMQPDILRERIAAGDYGPTGIGEVFPSEWNALCAGTNESEIEVGRRRRSLPPQGREV